ncbi:hypothetical protein Q5P01_019146 [Channa striata]|uniref:Uncharacterized protein n=1 Tax=Channa striata TaxID=64152 RepID=A0AA88M0R9_CHASR|nr:hypothetical protein Q5P01_019146 [Channa striata]
MWRSVAPQPPAPPFPLCPLVLQETVVEVTSGRVGPVLQLLTPGLSTRSDALSVTVAPPSLRISAANWTGTGPVVRLSTEGQSHKHIINPPPLPPGWQDSSVCLHSPNQQRGQTVLLRLSPSVCVCVCVSNDVCQGGELSRRRDLFKSAKPKPAAAYVCVRVEWSST